MVDREQDVWQSSRSNLSRNGVFRNYAQREIEIAENPTLREISIGGSNLLDKCIGDFAPIEMTTGFLPADDSPP